MKIVLATDGSTNALFAEEFLLRYPASGAKVFCCSAYSPAASLTATAHPFLGGLLAEQIAAALADAKEAAERCANESSARLKQQGVDAEPVVLDGDPAAEVAEFAEKNNAELTVLGARGISEIEEMFLGSVARALVNLSKNSVLVVRRKAFKESHGLHVTIATDFGPVSMQFVKSVPDLVSGRFATLDIVCALENADVIDKTLDGSNGEFQSAQDWFASEAKKLQEELAGSYDEATSHLLRGDARKAILEHASETGTDLIIAGARDQSALARFLLGSVSHHLAVRAPCSVLIVRP
jgi:nucleotide-binding universal stress UspA family protein